MRVRLKDKRILSNEGVLWLFSYAVSVAFVGYYSVLSLLSEIYSNIAFSRPTRVYIDYNVLI